MPEVFVSIDVVFVFPSGEFVEAKENWHCVFGEEEISNHLLLLKGVDWVSILGLVKPKTVKTNMNYLSCLTISINRNIFLLKNTTGIVSLSSVVASRVIVAVSPDSPESIVSLFSSVVARRVIVAVSRDKSESIVVLSSCVVAR